MSESKRSYNGLIIVILLLKSASFLMIGDIIQEAETFNEISNTIFVMLLPIISFYMIYKKDKNGYLLALLASIVLLPSLLGFSLSSVLLKDYSIESITYIISSIIETLYAYALWIEYNNTDYLGTNKEKINSYIDEKITQNSRIQTFLEITITAASTLFSLYLGLVLIGVIIWRKNLDLSNFGLSRPASWINTLGSGVAFGVGWTFLTLLFNYFLILFTGIPFHDSLDLSGNLEMYLSTLFSIVILVWLEDLIFRGYIQKEIILLLRDKRFNRYVGILGSSILWALCHSFQSITGMISLFVSGIFLGTIYEESRRNLWIPITIHVVYDLLIITFDYLTL